MGESETTGAAVTARTQQQQPTIGRQVRYLDRRGLELTATIIEVAGSNPDYGMVTLFVPDPHARTLDDLLNQVKQDVIFADKLTKNCWSWPPRSATG